MPKMAHGDFDKYAFHFWNQHHHTFGVKLEIPVATQRTPLPLGVTVAPAGWHDLAIARLPDGVLSRLEPGERLLGDPGYVGEPKIYAPPRSNMKSYVQELDRSELTLQRRVEMANRRVKEWKCLGTTYRKGAVRAFDDLQTIAVVVVKLVFLDILLNQEHSGHVHLSGPTPDLHPHRVAVPTTVFGPGARARLAKAAKKRSRPSMKSRNLLKMIKRVKF